MFTSILPTTGSPSNSSMRQNLLAMEASQWFERARYKAGLTRIWRRLTHAADQLEDLDSAGRRCMVANRYYAGTQRVAIRQIRGSESRNKDFDVDFNPIAGRVARRWQNMFLAFREGVSLPPVDLVEMADQYYVRDGHHRISVARALGQTYVDAIVTVWKTEACNLDRKGK